MLEINLLPEEFKIKAEKQARDVESRKILYFIPLVFGILIIIHIYLGSVFIAKNCQLGVLNNKWRNLEPQRKTVQDLQKERTPFSAETEVIQQLNKRRINYAEKLNKLSLYLPSGIWFNELSINPKDFTLKASVISLEKDEMGLINKFMDKLKKDVSFFGDFNNLELSSVQRRVIESYDVVDFILTGSLKSR